MADDALWYRGEFLASDGEHAAALLWEAGAGGVELRDQDTFCLIDDWAPVPDGKTRLIGFFELPDASQGEALTQTLGAIEGLEIVALGPFTDRSWETKWRDYFAPRALSARSVVGPPWASFEAPEGGVKLIIDPGMAFGTGTHETTQVVAELVDELLAERADRTILDVGTGSGILTLLAYLLGARDLYGIDIDATALENARANLPLNGVPLDAIPYDTTPVGALTRQYELVIANILATILLQLEGELKARVAPGGYLILSGLLHSQAGAIRETYVESGWQEVAARQRGDWTALLLRRDEVAR